MNLRKIPTNIAHNRGQGSGPALVPSPNGRPQGFPQAAALPIHSPCGGRWDHSDVVRCHQEPRREAALTTERAWGAEDTPGPESELRGPDMRDVTYTRTPAQSDRDDQLRGAARLLEHLANGEVSPDDVPSVVAGAVRLLERAGIIGEEPF